MLAQVCGEGSQQRDNQLFSSYLLFIDETSEGFICSSVLADDALLVRIVDLYSLVCDFIHPEGISLLTRDLIEQQIYFHFTGVAVSEPFFVVIADTVSGHDVGIAFITEHLTAEATVVAPDQERNE